MGAAGAGCVAGAPFVAQPLKNTAPASQRTGSLKFIPFE